MRQPIFGTGGVCSLLVSGVAYPVFCCLDFVFRWNQEVIGATTITSGKNKEKRVRMFEWFISVSGLTKIDRTDGQIDFFYLTTEAIRGTLQTIQMVYTDPDGNDIMLSGNVVIPSGELSAPSTDFSNASIEFAGTGELTIGDPVIPTPPAVTGILSDWWPVVDGQTYVDVGSIASGVHGYKLLSTDVVLETDRSGTQQDEVAGTPGNRQTRFNTSTLRVETDPSNPFNAGETVFILFKR